MAARPFALSSMLGGDEDTEDERRCPAPVLETTLSPELHAWVDAQGSRLVDEWRACCAIPSVSAEGQAAVNELAGWLEHQAAPQFDSFRTLKVEGAAPVLVGTLRGTGPKTLLIYNHYDVVPAGEGWTHDPFAAELIEGRVYARGAGDDKADVMARLQALRAWTEVHGRLPYNVLWLCEGMEEVGSPGLLEVIAAHADLLRADACLWESYYRSIDGQAATIGFGSRGVLNLELEVSLLESDTHSAMAGVYRSAAILLARAVASLIDDAGRVLIPGFYDDLRPFTGTDTVAVARTPLPPVTTGAASTWSSDPVELTRRWLYEPTLNLAAIHAGPDISEADATRLAASAQARLDIRLMPDQDPHRIFEALRAYLAANGFAEIESRLRNAIRPACAPLDSPLALAVRQASTELFGGAEPLLHAVVPGSGPLHLFTAAMPGLAAVMPPGTIRPDSGMHGPDENALVAHYLDEVRLTLRILELLSLAAGFGKEAETG